jgi:hypothetical protein
MGSTTIYTPVQIFTFWTTFIASDYLTNQLVKTMKEA